MNYRTIIISDIHLGSKYSRANNVIEFLKGNSCETLILNGDIIDGWALKRGSTWSNDHMRCLIKILKISKKTNIYWIRGNHDDFLYDFIPYSFGNITLLESMDYIGKNGKRYLVLHGDVFDMFIKDMKWLAYIGSVGYDFSLWLNKWYNKFRLIMGLEYFSLSKQIKNSVKTATNFISRFEEHMVNHANKMGYDGVICGHIHKAEITNIGNVEYMNSGDWVESNTALVEHFDGTWEIINFL
jgi:UDP-2,3-diacylglucosamine pyrophosphatase LpxH